jgi:hypothetical protein
MPSPNIHSSPTLSVRAPPLAAADQLSAGLLLLPPSPPPLLLMRCSSVALAGAPVSRHCAAVVLGKVVLVSRRTT